MAVLPTLLLFCQFGKVVTEQIVGHSVYWGNLAILLPLRFYVKTILVNSEIQKLPFLTVSEALDFDV